MPPLSNVHSARATARPPSEQSCAERNMRLDDGADSATSSARAPWQGPARAALPATVLWTVLRYSLPPSSPSPSPSRTIASPGPRNDRASTRRRIIDDADDADHRSRIDRLAVGLVVEADVAAGNRRIEGAARLGDPFDRLDELPHDLGTFGIAEVQAVGRTDRHARLHRLRCARLRQPRAWRRDGDRDSSSGRCRRQRSRAPGRFP